MQTYEMSILHTQLLCGLLKRKKIHLIFLISVHTQALLFARSGYSQDLKGLTTQQCFHNVRGCVCVCVMEVSESMDVLNIVNLDIWYATRKMQTW